MSELLQHQSDVLDQISDLAYQRGLMTRTIEISSKVRNALAAGSIDFKTYEAMAKILDEVKNG